MSNLEDRPPELTADTAPPVEDVTAQPTLETPEPTAGRLQRLRARLARSQTSLGRGLLSVLSRENLDDDAWEEVEESLLTADVGVGATTEIVERLRTRTKVLNTRSAGEMNHMNQWTRKLPMPIRKREPRFDASGSGRRPSSA